MNLQNIFKKIRYNCGLKRRDCWVPEGIPVDEPSVTSHFGWRADPRNRIASIPQYHGAVDLSVPEGTEVYTTAAGIVSKVDKVGTGSAGRYVEIEHRDDQGILVYKTKYFHNSEILVNTGEFVGFGSKIAKSGKTGRLPNGDPSVTGPHVHYEIWYNGKAIDPEDFFETWNTGLLLLLQ